MAGTGASRRSSCPPLSNIELQYPLSRAGGGAAAPRRHRPARCRGLGLCARGRRLGRRYHRELRSNRNPPRRCRRRGSIGNHARGDSIAKSGRIGGRQHQRGDGARGRAPAPGEFSAAGLGVGTHQTHFPLRRDVQHHSRLHQPVGQGGAGDRRGHRCLHLVHSAGCVARQYPRRMCRLPVKLLPTAAAAMLRAIGRTSSMWIPKPLVTIISGDLRSRQPVSSLAGWGEPEDFKATPGFRRSVFAWTQSQRDGNPHPINAPFTIGRFAATDT